MKRFARILELPKSQVLLTVGENEDEVIELKITMDFDGFRSTITLSGFQEEDHAIQEMDDYTAEKAERLYNSLAKTFGE